MYIFIKENTFFYQNIVMQTAVIILIYNVFIDLPILEIPKIKK